MISLSRTSPKVFAVLFKDFKYWDVRSLYISMTNRCNWTTVPLASVCKIRFDVVPEEELRTGIIKLLDRISFDEGKVFAGKRTDTKMVQYRAKPGDIAVSKINARKRAIGIVPDGCNIGITIHFRALIPDTTTVNTNFLWAALRSSFCTKQFDMKTGGIGKGEISEEQLLSVEIPLPPLPIQQAIVDRWQKAQDEIKAASNHGEDIKQSLGIKLLKKLGISLPPVTPRKGAFTLEWKDFERWDTFYYRVDFTELEEHLLSMRHARLGEILNFTSRPWKTSDFPDGTFEYIEISNVTKNEGIIGSRIVEVNKAPSRATTLLKEEDIILATTRPYLGSFAVVPKKYNNCVCSSGFALADEIKISDIEKDFLLFYLKSPAGLRQMERRMTGGLYPAIVQEELEKILIPLPPLNVQQEIIRQVDEGRVKIAHEGESAERKSREIEAEIEALILGTKTINN